jgi:PEP-CTERM motif
VKISYAPLCPVLVVFLMVMAFPAWGQYNFTNFNGTGDSSLGTTVNGINNDDQIVGFSTGAAGNTNWLRNPDGTFITLNVINTSSPTAMANGANVAPTVVGMTGTNAFSYNGGTLTLLPAVNATTTSMVAFGINDPGVIVGQYTDSATGTSPGFVHNGGSYTTLNPVSGNLTVNAQGINTSGLVTGFYSTDGITSHGFLYNTGASTFTFPADPSVANFLFVQLLGINDHGEVAGYYDLTNGTQIGLLYNTSTLTYTFLSDPAAADIGGVMITQITGISNSGEIAGFYVGADDLMHGFFATPVPEPATLLMLIPGLLAVGYGLRRKLLA